MGSPEAIWFTHVDTYTTDAHAMQYVAYVENKPFHDWFKFELKRREMNQADFARRSGIAPSTVSSWATGDRVPDPESCDLIADVLLVDRDMVLALAGHRTLDEPLKANDPRRDIIAAIRQLDPSDPITLFWLETLSPAIEKLKKLDSRRRPQ